MFYALNLKEFYSHEEDRIITLYEDEGRNASNLFGYGANLQAFEDKDPREHFYMDLLFKPDFSETLVGQTLQAFLKAYSKSKDKYSLFTNEIIPKSLIIPYCEERMKLIVQQAQEDQIDFLSPFYLYMLNVFLLLQEIKGYTIKINQFAFQKHLREGAALKGIEDGHIQLYLLYNHLGAVTGRLGTLPGSFPILNFKRELRDIIQSQYGTFAELDFEAADVRTTYNLFAPDIDYSERDIYSEICSMYNIQAESRADMKQKVFAQLYAHEESRLHKELRISEKINDMIIRERGDHIYIETPYHRVLKLERKERVLEYLPYIIQSVTNDAMLSAALEIQKLIYDNERGSRICFLMHDSLTLDMPLDELEDLQAYKDIYVNTKIGKYKVHLKAGKDFGNMVEESNT